MIDMFIRMEPSTKERNRERREKGGGYLYGLMELDMKDSGRMIEQKAKAHSIMLMEIFMKDNGKRTKQKDMEYIGNTVYDI